MNTRTLQEISIHICDGVHNTVLNDDNGSCYLLSAKNVKNGKINIGSNDRRINQECRNKLNKRTLMAPNDVVITTVGTIGELAIVGDDYKNFEFQRSVGIIKPNPGIIDSKFLYYTLLDPAYQTYLKVIATGAAQPCLFISSLNKLKINYPDLPTQVSISKILSTYDDLIENNNKRIKILEQMAQELYKEWFVRHRFPGYKDIKIENGLPVGWDVIKVGDKFDTVLGGTPSRENAEYWDNGTIPWINSGAINLDRIITANEYITDIAYKRCATELLPVRSTLVAITGATLGQVSLNEIEVCTNQSVVGIIDQTKLYSLYLFFYLKTCITDLSNYASGGAQQHINKDIINKYKIIIPNEELVRSFNDIVLPIFDEIKNLLFMNTNLIKQRDLLLPRLMSGKLEIKRTDDA